MSEKALKAAIASRDFGISLHHDLGALMQLCEDAGFELSADLAESGCYGRLRERAVGHLASSRLTSRFNDGH